MFKNPLHDGGRTPAVIKSNFLQETNLLFHVEDGGVRKVGDGFEVEFGGFDRLDSLCDRLGLENGSIVDGRSRIDSLGRSRCLGCCRGGFSGGLFCLLLSPKSVTPDGEIP